MVYTGMAIVPTLAALAGTLTLVAVKKAALSRAVASLLFIVSVPVGMVLSFFFVNAFSHLLHGDGALAIVAAPVTGAILTIPVALVFTLLLVRFASPQQ